MPIETCPAHFSPASGPIKAGRRAPCGEVAGGERQEPQEEEPEEDGRPDQRNRGSQSAAAADPTPRGHEPEEEKLPAGRPLGLVEPRPAGGRLDVTRGPGPSLCCDALGHATFVPPTAVQRRAIRP
jgi:hypothetical protein